MRFVTLNCGPPHPEAFILLTPAPKNCHADPLHVFMSKLCLRATARSHFNYHTPLSGRRVHTESVRVRVWVVSFVRVYMHACIHICHRCTVYAMCIYLPFLKRQQRAKCGWESRIKVFAQERERETTTNKNKRQVKKNKQ